MIVSSRANLPPPSAPTAALSVYLLGTVELTAIQTLRELLWREAALMGHASVVLCEHPQGLSVGRSRNLDSFRQPLALAQPWSATAVWVARGGGIWPHTPGQINCYCAVPTNHSPLHELPLTEAATCIGRAMQAAAGHTGVSVMPVGDELRTRDHLVGWTGLGVRRNVVGFGGCLNVSGDTRFLREVGRLNSGELPASSLQAVCGRRVTLSDVKLTLAERLAAEFGFERVNVFTRHPALARRRSQVHLGEVEGSHASP